MKFRVTESDEEWQELLAGRPDALLYHCLPWLRFQVRSFGYQLILLVGHHNGQVAALLPLLMTQKGPLRVAASPKGLDYLMLGPLADEPLFGEVLDGYEAWAKSHGVDYTSMAWTGDIDRNLAESRNYSWERHINCVIDLAGGEEAVFSRMNSECRRRIRQSQKTGVEIIEGDMSSWFEQYVRLSGQIFDRSNKNTILTEAVLADLVRTIEQIGPVLSIRAEVDGQVAGMYIGAGWRDTFYALDTVWDRKFHRCSPNNAMNWYALKWSCQQGFRRFDLGGGRISNLRKFKAGLGAELVTYSNIQKAHSWRARTLVDCKEFFGSLLRKVARSA